MGLLPIFLALAGFIFLFSLVNYNSFAAKRTYIRQLREWTEELNGQSEQITGALVAQARAQHIQLPGELSRPTGQQTEEPDNLSPLEQSEHWGSFVAGQPALAAQPAVTELLGQLNETATNQLRTQTRLQAAVQDYNRHRQKMPFRIIAVLFGFRPA